jgi:hypothetical protein
LVLALANIHARLCLSLLRSGLSVADADLQALYLRFFEEFFSNAQCVLSPEVFQLAVGLAWPGALALAEGGLIFLASHALSFPLSFSLYIHRISLSLVH